VNVDRFRKIYLIGICGTAMASVAGLLKERGYDVSGSDANVYPPMSTQLEKMEVRLYQGFRAENLREAAPDLVIPGNIPRGNPELEELLNLRLPYCSMTEAIKDFFLREKRSIVIAGTHGKTTTSSLAAWLLQHAGLNPSFLVGGLPLNFVTSYQWNPRGKYFVIEGDEYDTGFMDRRPKFVNYLPQIVLLNAVEFDHADVYPDLAAIENAFWQLVKVVPANGTIIVTRDNETAFHVVKRGYSKVISYGFHPESDEVILIEKWESGAGIFQLGTERFRFPTFGKHNISNAAAVAILGKTLGISTEQIQGAFDAFQGIKRRMELRGEVNGIAVYDDFAHHPTAIDSTLEGVRLTYPNSRIWGIFEPRSWSSRRNVFQKEFGRSFRFADLALIAPVFEPERLDPSIRLNPAALIDEIRRNGTSAFYFGTNNELLEFVIANAKPGDKLIVMSNGSFDGMHEKILNRLRSYKE
jgi:UDP-N-acetylmuramate: L-alanyl-gamma-D-glutamyl-meso-diaminopimelate ligase